MKRIIVFLTTLFSLYFFILYFTDSKETNWHFVAGLLQSIIAIIGALGGFISLSGISGKMRSAIVAASVALLAQGVSLMFWVYYVMVSGIEVPYPSLADWILALSRIFLVIVLIVFIFIYRTNVTKYRLYFAVLLGIITGAVVYYFTGAPEITDKASLTLVFFDVFWGIIGVITSGFAVIVLNLSGGKIMKGIRILTFGLIAVTIADLLFVFRVNRELYWNGDVSDIVLLISIAIVSYGVIALSESNKRIEM